MLSVWVGWWQDRRARGLIAASLYEPLTAEDQAFLERRLAASPALRREAEDLRAFVGTLPAQPVAFSGDLLPGLRAEIEQRETAGTGFRWPHLAGATATAGVFVVMLAFGLYVGSQPAGPGSQLAQGVTTETAAAPAAVARAREQVAQGTPREAMRTLQAALADTADPVQAAEAQALIADIEFSHLGRYPQAWQAYNALRTEHSDHFAGDPMNSLRFQMLEEARPHDYAPLYALHAAGEEPDTAFAQYEQVLAQYPNTLAARVALEEMVALAGHSGAAGGMPSAEALEAVRSRCQEPIAVAWINQNLGEAYWHGLEDLGSARECFLRAQESPDAQVRQLAEGALAQLAATDTR